MEKPGEQKPISNIPKAQSKLATKACLREHRKNKRAEIKITRKPGNSRGSSKKPRWKSVIRKVSFKKLLKVESTILCANPKTKVAAKNSRKSSGNALILFIVLLKMATFLPQY
jgi:DNA primase catalytic subunit